MKEAIRMVPESIYDSEFPGHIALPLGGNLSLFRIRHRKHIIDRHRLIPILKEEIDDPKFFYHTRKLLGSGRRKMNGLTPSHTSTTIGPTGQHLPTQARSEIGRIRHNRIDDQAVEEASFNAPKTTEPSFWGGSRASNAKRPFIPLFRRGTHRQQAPPSRGDQNGGAKLPARRVPYGPSLFLCAAVRRPILCRVERRDRLSVERRPARKPLKDHDLIRISSHRNTKRLTHFLQSGPNLWSAGSTTIAAECSRIPRRESHTILARAGEARLRVKHRIHITAYHLRSAIHSRFRNLGKSLPIKEPTRGMSGRRSLLDAVQLAETLGTKRSRSPQQGAIGRSLTIGHECNDPGEVVIVYSEGGGRKKGTLGGIFRRRIPHTDRGPYQKDTPKASGSRSH
ncbi:hypothetical protein MKW92_000184 [Papaver armeniacum]|nr:hypothetical protein MKW92_000184 [Papaver armeniacum]